VAALDLGQSLGVEVIVVGPELPELFDEATAVFPAGNLRDEVGGASELDVDPQRLLEVGQRLKQAILVRNEENVHVDRAVAPTAEHGRGVTGQIDSYVAAGRISQRLQQRPDAGGVSWGSHRRRARSARGVG
jgi:hypothetical protein